MEHIVENSPVKRKGGRPKGSKSKAKDSAGAPSSDVMAILQTPEAQSVIAAAVAVAVANMAKDREADAPTEKRSDFELIHGLAAAITEMSDQNSKVKRIPVAEMRRRKAEDAKMQELILEAVATNSRPEYYVNRKVFLAEELIDPTWVDANKIQRRTKIVWRGVPNEGMEPVEGNHTASAIYAAFLESIGGRTPHAHRANYTLDGKTVPEGELVVLHKGLRSREAPAVGRGRGGVEHIGRHMPGEIVETAVLGTIHAPARQVA